MDIFINVAGPISDGLDSPTRGEGRWTLNIARILADAGHRVLMSSDGGNTSWGRGAKHPNIEIVQWRDLGAINHIEFDVYFTVNHIPGREYPVRSKIKMSGAYSLGGLMIEPEVSRVQKDLYTLSPGADTYATYSKSLEEKNIPWKNRYKLLCQPYGKEFGKDKFKNKTIVFSAKEVFHHTLTRLHEDARKNIFAAIDACKETGAKFVAVSSEWTSYQYIDTVKNLGIFDKVRELDNHRILPIIPWPVLMNELASASILMPLGFAGCTPDGIFSGLVPLLRSDCMLIWHPDYDIKGLLGEMGDTKNMTQDELKNVIVRLLTDEVYYNHFQESIQKIMIDHLDHNVLKQFNDIIEYDAIERSKAI